MFAIAHARCSEDLCCRNGSDSGPGSVAAAHGKTTSTSSTSARLTALFSQDGRTERDRQRGWCVLGAPRTLKSCADDPEPIQPMAMGSSLPVILLSESSSIVDMIRDFVAK